MTDKPRYYVMKSRLGDWLIVDRQTTKAVGSSKSEDSAKSRCDHANAVAARRAKRAKA